MELAATISLVILGFYSILLILFSVDEARSEKMFEGRVIQDEQKLSEAA